MQTAAQELPTTLLPFEVKRIEAIATVRTACEVTVQSRAAKLQHKRKITLRWIRPNSRCVTVTRDDPVFQGMEVHSVATLGFELAAVTVPRLLLGRLRCGIRRLLCRVELLGMSMLSPAALKGPNRLVMGWRERWGWGRHERRWQSFHQIWVRHWRGRHCNCVPCLLTFSNRRELNRRRSWKVRCCGLDVQAYRNTDRQGSKLERKW